jgi:hypothetical protein
MNYNDVSVWIPGIFLGLVQLQKFLQNDHVARFVVI